MTDDELHDIVDGLERCSDLEGKKCDGCPWEDGTTGECFNRLAGSALELLEMLKPKYAYWKWDPDGMDWNLPAWRCSSCHARNDCLPANIRSEEYILQHSGSRFCPNCGSRMVKGWKWNYEC